MVRISQWCCLMAVLLISNTAKAEGGDFWSALFEPRQGSNTTVPPANASNPSPGGDDPLAASNNATVSPLATGNATEPPETDDLLEPEGNVTLDDLTDSPLDGNMTVPPVDGVNGTVPPTQPDSIGPIFTGIFFQFNYGFEAMAEREPTEAEVVEIVCITSQWIRDTVRNATGDNTVESTATNIDWSFDPTPNTVQPVSVIFLSNTTYNYETPVAPTTVGEATSASTDQIVQYITNYVFQQVKDPDSLFAKTTSANFESPETTFPIPEGKLDTITCPADTDAPTISPAPTVSPAPSSAPTISPMPTTSPAPSSAPTVSPAPTTEAENPNAGGDNDKSIPPVEGGGTGGSSTTSPGPGGPTRPPAPDGARRQEIHAKFIVSNLDDIVQPSIVNASGLNDAWGPFVAEVVRETAAESRKRGLREASSHHRLLQVEYETGSAHMYDIILVDCPDKTHPDLTCHDAYGAFSIFLYGDDRERPGVQEQKYGNAVVDRIEDGTLQETLDEVRPNSGLYIGALGDPNSGGIALWLLILIILLCILFCCCLLGALFFFFVMNKDRGGDQKLDAYDEEGFAYDFLIPPHQKVQTEVDDEVEDASTKDADGDDEEFFEDEAGGAVEAKAVDDAAPATKMEEEDDEEDNDEEAAAEVSDEEGVNVTADATDSDDEAKPLVDGDDADSDDEPEMVEVSNEMEGSESFHETAENWDDEENKDAKNHSDEEDWDDEEDGEKKK